MEKKCSICDQQFSCGMSDDTCWCASYPTIFKIDKSLECLCPSCLKDRANDEIHAFVSAFKMGKTKNIAPAYNTEPKTFQEGIDYYVENGNYVFTAWSHLKRGHCCGSGCRHCPYPEKQKK